MDGNDRSPKSKRCVEFDGSRIPEELKLLRRWVNWRYVERNGKRTKVPLNPHTGAPASCDDRTTWGGYEEAVGRLRRGEADGIGFQLGPPYVGIDLDKCRNAETGAIEPWAQDIIRAIDSYSETSPSKSGVHILAKGQLPPGGRRKGRLEMYDVSRYLTVTGQRLNGPPATIQERTEELGELHARIFGKNRSRCKPANGAGSANHPLTDAELIEKARRAKDGVKFDCLWRGDYSEYDSRSESDLALCMILAFWTWRDRTRMDRLFRQSGLYRLKWDERHGADGRSYGQLTIDRAIEQTTEVWRTRYGSKADGGESDGEHGPFPLILVTDRQLRDLTCQAIQALAATNDPPALFVRGGALARVRADENGRPIIENVGEYELRNRLSQIADYARLTNRGNRIQCAPSLDVVRDILAAGTWTFPPLEGIVEGPILRPDGTVLTEPGYDPFTHLFYARDSSLRIPTIPSNPTADDVVHARLTILEAIGEFPYEESASAANATGLLLTPVIRPAIKGPVPMCCTDAPQQGTGKSLLASVVAITTTGRDAEMMLAPRDEEEMRKRITAVLYEGATFITIDNVDRPLESPSLASVLTATVWKDRILGLSKTATVQNRATWTANGNNLQVGGDIPRRCYWVRLNAKSSRPWKRTGFKHPDLIAWVYEDRGRLLAALLTIARAWYAAGKPAADVAVIGGFEVWARTLGGILECAGFIDPATDRPAFLGNLEKFYELADTSTPQWQEFLELLSKIFGERPFTAKELTELLKSDQALREAHPDDLADIETSSFSKRLGQAFSKRVGTRYGDSGVHIERAGEEKRATKWRVVLG
jgi:hypothetical protein